MRWVVLGWILFSLPYDQMYCRGMLVDTVLVSLIRAFKLGAAYLHFLRLVLTDSHVDNAYFGPQSFPSHNSPNMFPLI